MLRIEVCGVILFLLLSFVVEISIKTVHVDSQATDVIATARLTRIDIRRA
jgi:hypothetical protein